MTNYSFYIIIALSLSLLLIFGLVLPRYRDWDSLNQEIFKRGIELRSQENYFQEIQRISGKLKENQDSLSKIESALPEDRSLPQVLNFFQKAASQSGTTLKHIVPVFVVLERGQNIRTTKVNLVLGGDYYSFKNFLSLVEKSARLIEVENIYFSYPKEGGPFIFNISTKTYSY